jgi:hypothetical protein
VDHFTERRATQSLFVTHRQWVGSGGRNFEDTARGTRTEHASRAIRTITWDRMRGLRNDAPEPKRQMRGDLSHSDI